MAKFCIIIFLLLLYSVSLTAQYDNIKFEHISVEQGLSYETVTCILQDNHGFIWFGTEDGLNLYDGYQFTTYRHDPDDYTSIGSNHIESIFEDHSGTLWMGTIAGGLNKFNRETETFSRFKYDQTNPFSIISNDLRKVCGFRYEDKDVLWIGTKRGLCKMDIALQKFIYYPHTNKKYPNTDIWSMVVDSSGIVWFGTVEGGLHKFDPRTEQYTHYLHDPDNPYSLSDSRVLSLFIDRAGMLWIGTGNGGLNKFNRKNNIFFHYQPEPGNSRSLSSNWIFSIYEDSGGSLWIGTPDMGLNIFDRQTEHFTRYLNVPGDPESLSDNSVRYIYEDGSGVIWLGTRGGVNKIDPAKTNFSVYKNIPGNPNSLTSGIVASILGSAYGGKNLLWISTKSGLNKLDRESGKYTRYVHDPYDAKSIPGILVISLFEDRFGSLWIGTFGDGLIKFDHKTEQFTQYFDRKNPTNIILSIYEDKNEVLWISTKIGGLYKFDRETEMFTRVGNAIETTQVLEDKSGSLWVATIQGLKKLNRETEEFFTYQHDPQNPNSLSNNKVMTIYKSQNHEEDVLWIGTEGGLNKLDYASETFRHFTVDDGLPNNMILGILEDSRGNIWLSTNGGISKFNPKNNTFRNYDIGDGLPGNPVWPGRCFKGNDGELFFGTSKGMVSFNPDRMIDNPHVPKIVITEFRIFNEKVEIKRRIDEGHQREYTLAKHISKLKEIKLSYKENIFSFEFAALDYRSPENNRYAYMMGGFENAWNYTDYTRRFATYTNLDPGEYLFRVKGTNNNGIWNDEGATLKIIITPPWWKTSWAYSFYIFLIVLILYALRTYDQKRQRLKNELELEQIHAKKLEEVDQMKSRFFANISHEFRTPLTLIKGPIKQMLHGNFLGNVKEQYEIILRYSDRLLGLINQILDLSKLESGQMKLKVAQTDVISVVKGLVFSFTSLAERKNITLNFNANNKSHTGYVDQDKMEKIITNLLSNAFKFTLENGEIDIHIRMGEAFPDDDFVEIKVVNTGPGIPQEELSKIFDRFYQSSTIYKKDGEGSGIGLALTKELVELCRGEISVLSIPNKTTTFRVILPISKVYYKENEIIKELETENRRPEMGKHLFYDSISGEDTGYQIPDVNKQSKVLDRSAASGLPSPLLLIVEDNPDVTSYICSFLDHDYQIITTINGKEGWRDAVKKHPDLILSDVMMPEMDGFELCKKLKSDQRTSHIPVILLTAKADLDSKIEGLEFGADDYISKPFEADELKARIKNLIELRRQLRLKFEKELVVNPAEITVGSMDEKFLNKVCTILEKHMANTNLTAEQLAGEINMSYRNMNRKIKVLTGKSARKFISIMRLKRAAQ